jgi:L-phenylalanine/L-methionine N-acetyltransferase
MIIVRKIKKSDIYALADILNKKEVRTYLYLDDGKKITYKEQNAWWAQQKLEKNKLILVAIVDKQVAGSIHITFYSQQVNKNRANFGMFVDSKFWGRGVARELMNHAEQELVTRDVMRLEANGLIFSTNKRGLTFYKKRGFIVEGRAKKALWFNGKLVDGIYIAKEVSGL